MKYNLKIGQYHGYADVELEIPEGLKFFYDKGTVGRCLSYNCEHYTTVIEKGKYDEEWFEHFSNSFGVQYETIGGYVVLTICSLHNDTPIPTVDRETWFKENNIDFGQYTFVTYDADFVPMNAYKIMNFQDIWDIDVNVITVRDYFSQGEYFSSARRWLEWDAIEPTPFSDNPMHLKVYDGKEAKVIWNTLFAEVMKRYSYEAKYVDVTYDLMKVQKDALKKLGFKDIDEYNNFFKKKD